MMKIKFTEILIENFKNIDKLEVIFGNKTFVYGANETGKTTFADAISWCLTGKNSLGDSQFEFVPIGKNGVSPSVTLQIDISGNKKDIVDHVVLQRVYQAKQNRSKEFTGDYQTVCYVNRLKVGVREFEKWIDEHICNPEIFRLIHDVRYFTENISTNGRERPWEAQRRLLFSISGIKADIDFAKSKKRFEPILEGLKRYDNSSQYISFLKLEEKRFEDEIRETNHRISMMKSMIEEYGGWDDEDIDEQIEKLRLAKVNLDTEIEQETKRVQAEREKNISSIKRLYNDKVSAFKKEQEEYSGKLRELNDRRQTLSNKRVEVQCAASSSQFNLKRATEAYNIKDIDVQCPTCGQYIPTEMIEEKQKNLKQKIEKLESEVESYKKSEEEILRELIEVEKQISALSAPVYPEELREIQRNLTVAENIVISDKLDEKNRKLEEITEELDGLIFDKKISDRNKKAKEEIEEIKKKVKELLELKANNSRLMDLCNDFVDTKCKSAEKKVNSLFDGIEFKLFHQNKTNGEVKPCCEIYWNNVPYWSLSYSTKFIVSMKIALAFQKFYKVEMPLVVDNAESIDFGQEIPVQTILLVKRDECCPKCKAGGAGRKCADGYWHCLVCENTFVKRLEIVTE